MNKLTKLVRLLQINWVLMRYSFNRTVLGPRAGWLRHCSYLNPFSWQDSGRSRGEALRLTLESLGPIFVKFGQLLSTRNDLIPADIIAELEKLQSQVPPFSSAQALRTLECVFCKKIDAVFASFDPTPLASASIAQVHAATLFSGEGVVVKIVRPGIYKIIEQDVGLLYTVATFTERFWSQGYRLRPRELVAEFERTLLDELDMVREAGNAAQLGRNFAESSLLYVPQIYWDYTSKNVLVMERIYGVPISHLAELRNRHVDLKKLSERGVEIFFTQVFRDSFFHADMHPGNIFVDAADPNNPRYLGVDFGIMGSLSPFDLNYLAQNLLAFFKRDYRRVALLHIESGWVPSHTRVDQFESAIRTVCEPIFQKPLKDISFGQLLLRLFQTAERFDMEVQPQLLLLQKTLLNVESLGRAIYPDLDLWITAKPFLQRFIQKQKGIRPWLRSLTEHLPEAIDKGAQIPASFLELLQNLNRKERKESSFLHRERTLQKQGRQQKRGFLVGFSVAFVTLALVNLLHLPLHWNTWPNWPWVALGVGGTLLLIHWLSPKEKL